MYITTIHQTYYAKQKYKLTRSFHGNASYVLSYYASSYIVVALHDV